MFGVRQAALNLSEREKALYQFIIFPSFLLSSSTTVIPLHRITTAEGLAPSKVFAFISVIASLIDKAYVALLNHQT